MKEIVSMKRVVAFFLALILACLAGCSSQPTIQDAKSILARNVTCTYNKEEGELRAFLMLTGEDGYKNNSDADIADAFAEQFGTPSYSELRKLCEEAKDSGTNIEEVYETKKLSIRIQTTPTKNKTLMVFFIVTEK